MIVKTNLKRAEVYWVSLEPAIGTETKKRRPGVIVSNDTQNMVGNRVIIAPLTSVTKRIYPFEIPVDIEGKKSKVMLDQIRTVDSQKLGGKIGKLRREEIEALDKTLKLVLALS